MSTSSTWSRRPSQVSGSPTRPGERAGVVTWRASVSLLRKPTSAACSTSICRRTVHCGHQTASSCGCSASEGSVRALVVGRSAGCR
jgi:hypothetical protein